VTCIPDGHWHIVIIPEVVLIQLSSWGRAQSCSKHVEDSNKHIIEKKLCVNLVTYQNYSFVWFLNEVWQHLGPVSLLLEFCTVQAGMLLAVQAGNLSLQRKHLPVAECEVIQWSATERSQVDRYSRFNILGLKFSIKEKKI